MEKILVSLVVQGSPVQMELHAQQNVFSTLMGFSLIFDHWQSKSGTNMSLSDCVSLFWGFSLLFPQLWGKCQGITRKDEARRALFPIWCWMCCSKSCLCEIVYCTTATGWQPNCSYQIYHISYIPPTKCNNYKSRRKCANFICYSCLLSKTVACIIILSHLK